MKWPKIKKEKEVSPENVICKNCETKFSGHYCPECGQSVKEFDKPFSFVIYNFAGDFFSFDTRFFKTFFYLMFFPGKLTTDFFKGKRVRYAPPFRIFIFVSFILFFVLQIYSNRGLTKLLDSSINDTANIKLDSVSVNLADSLMTELNSTLDTTGTSEMILDASTEILTSSVNIRQLLNKLAVYYENKLANETNVKKKARLREYIRWCRSPEDGWAKILEYMSWAFFLLLPVFALILKLFYIRRKQNYIRHLIFSIHLHSFIFIDFFFIIFLNMLFSNFPGVITFILFLAIPLYFILALKNFYTQNIGKILVKFLGISLLYNIVFWIAVGFVLTSALSLA
jgi:hypothetical protein